MAEKYGNLPLGQVSELLVSIIGRDAALAIADEKGIPIIEKDLDRMFKEEDVSFARFKPKEKTSVYELYRAFSEILEKEYGIPNFVHTLVFLNFIGTFRNAIRGNGTQPKGNNIFIPLEGGLIPYEIPTSKLSLLLLNWSLGYLGFEYKDEDINIFKKSVERLLDDTYEIIFDKIVEKTAENKDDFYRKLGVFYNEKYPDSEKMPDFKQAIKRYCKGSNDIPWKTLKLILDFLISPKKGEKELVHRLIGLYILKNTESALREICGIEQKDIYQIKQDVRLWAKNELPSEPQSESQCFLMIAGKDNPCDLSELQKHFIDPDFCKQVEVIQKCNSYLRGENSIKADKAEQLIQEMIEECPHCGIFFASWAKARLAILSCRFDGSEEDKNLQRKALENYHKAFNEGKNFAGALLKYFLEESIAVTVYFNRRETKDIPKVIDSDKSLKTPITDDVKGSEKHDASYGAKQYYEYGYALNLFEQDSSETFFLHFHAEKNFWEVFSLSLFIHSETAKNRYSEDMLKANGIFHAKEGLNPYKISLKEKLESITEKTINHRIEWQPGHPVHYTPLSFALQRHELDIAEKYLKDLKNLDVNVINTHGSTALEEALTQYYKRYRFSCLDKQREERYKRIIMELIERSTIKSLYAETVRGHISVLQEAINTFDIDIVKAIVEKKGFNIQGLKISADELSPLYYTLQRCYNVSHLISIGELSISNMNNINYAKLDVPGVLPEDKIVNYENMIYDPRWKMTEKLSYNMFYGKPEIWEQELSELKEIVKYLADKTDNVDTFAKKAPNGDCTTALSLAVECGFDDICRLLIEKGANPARIFSNNGIPYDSPFIRAAWFKSYKILEMLLTDFKEKIKPIINERYKEDRQTAAHMLLGNIYKYSVNNENFKFIEQFIPLLRNAGAEFNIPDISNTTVRQILRENNLEALIK